MYPCMLYQVYFHRVLHQISGLLPLLYYSCLHPAIPLVFYSATLLPLSYYTMSIPAWYHLLSLSCSACLCSRYGFQCIFMIQIYRYTCAYLCTPLGISITTCWGVLTLLDPHIQGSWSLWILPVADLRSVAVAWISSRPSEALSFQALRASLEFSFCKLVSAFYTVHTCTSLYILVFAPIGDVIFL